MLQIVVPAMEYWNESVNEFVHVEEVTLQLEHSLVSLSKWESKWCKPFFSKDEKSYEETIDYIKCMTITSGVDDAVYSRLSNANVMQINEYIEAPMTATTFSKDKGGKTNKEIVTSELIYYWMASLNIWLECENWHLNRLLTLIRVFNAKNEPQKNMSKKDIFNRNRALNAARKNKLNTRG